MEKAILETVKVYSPIEDKEIRNTLGSSPIWEHAYHEDEYKDAMMKKNHKDMFEYSFKFAGTKVVQLTGVKKISK
jgi:hypothetical protein